MKKLYEIFTILICVFGFFLKSSVAIPIFGSGPLSSYTGNFEYLNGTLTITLTNTSPYEVFLTAFAFNNPNDYITGVTLQNITHPSFQLLGAAANFDNGINAQPFGYFDIGAGLGGKFQGGGKPSPGIDVGETGTFTFNLSGTNLNMLTTGSFLSELSHLGSQGDGNTAEFFIARFRGPAGSNKSPGGSPIPEPSTLLLLGSGILFGVGFSRFRRRK